jgi:signal peptidase I
LEVKKNDRGKETLKKKSTLREYAEAAAIAILLALFIRTFVVQAFKIPSGSMEPTLLVGDHILVNKFIYGIKMPFTGKTVIPVSEPHRGDVVVFVYPEDKTKDFIKRVIGLPGDTLDMRDHEILINGKRFADRHAFYAQSKENSGNFSNPVRFGPLVTVPPAHYFVMGDNRDQSYDSRWWGFVGEDAIRGKAFVIYWSWPHWHRFLKLIR